MDDWDQDKLEEVVKQKHGTEKNRPTDIICKFFLDAVEKKMYGWCGAHCSLAPPIHWPVSAALHDWTNAVNCLQVLAVSQREGVQIPTCSATRLCPEVPDEGAVSIQPSILLQTQHVQWLAGILLCMLLGSLTFPGATTPGVATLSAGATGSRSSQCKAH